MKLGLLGCGLDLKYIAVYLLYDFRLKSKNQGRVLLLLEYFT